MVKGIGGKGIAFIRIGEDSTACSFSKFMTEEEMNAIYSAMGAEKGDVILIIADTNNSHVLTQLGQLRTTVAKKLDIIPDQFNFLWVVEFPFFEYDEEEDLGSYASPIYISA